MKSYDSSDLTMLTKYTKLMAKEVEMAKEFEDIENKDLTEAEALYYSEVSLRCTDKMLLASGEIDHSESDRNDQLRSGDNRQWQSDRNSQFRFDAVAHLPIDLLIAPYSALEWLSRPLELVVP